MSYVKYKLHYRFSDDGEPVLIDTFEEEDLEDALAEIKEFFLGYGGSDLRRLKLTKNNEEIPITYENIRLTTTSQSNKISDNIQKTD